MKYVNSVFMGLVFLMMPVMAVSDTNDALITKRTYGKDLLGYSKQEKDLAANILENKLHPEKKKLEERIKNSDSTAQQLKEAKIELDKINQNINDQEVIANKKYSTFVSRILYGLAAATFIGSAIAADYLFNYSSVRYNLDSRYRNVVQDIIQSGGLFNYLRNETLGEPYIIKPVSELEFWNRDTNEWQPVAENEELAKRSLVRSCDGCTVARYDEDYGTMVPHRGVYYFWDSLINAFRRTTMAEDRAGIFRKQHLHKWLASDGELKNSEALEN